MPAFRPSLVANFKIRFDEALQVVRTPEPVSVEQQISTASNATTPPQVEPLIVRTGVENSSFVMGRVPLKASVELPGYRQAGQFSIDLAFKDMPIDPRTVRAAAVEIHLGSVSADDFAIGMAGSQPGQTRASILQTRDAAGLPRADTLILVGFVDEWNVEHADGSSTISMKGRDARGILLETPVGAGIPGAAQTMLEELDLSRPIDEVVARILKFHPLFAGFQVVANKTEWPNGVIPSPARADSAPRHRRGARGTRAGARGTPNGDQNNLNFWDLVTRYCYLVGAIPYFQGLQLLIRPSRSIFDQQDAGIDPERNPTPFAGGRRRDTDAVSRSAITPALAVRRLVYGRDVKKLSFDRKYGGWQRPKVVRCISHDPSSGAAGVAMIVSGQWPPAATNSQQDRNARRTRVAPGGQQTQEEVLNIPVPGIRDTTQLADIARSVYEEIGRGEMGGVVETKNLASFGGDNADPDLLHLRPGDGIELLVDVRNLSIQTPLISTLTDHLRNSFDQQVAAITNRIGDENLARVMVATARGAIQQLQNFFRVANVRYTWGKDGINIAFDFQNYVVARNQLGTSVTSRGTPQQVTVARTLDVARLRGTR